VKTILSVPPIQYAKVTNLWPISIGDTVREFRLDCKEKIQLKRHFSQINEGDDIGEKKKAILQLILSLLNTL